MQTIINNELKAKIEVPFNRDKTIKKIMKIENEVFMPKHIPQGTPEDPDNPDYREFTQEEKDACRCPNCKYPFKYFDKKDDAELKRTLASMEEVKRNPC
tara:strand:+ start:162 stop:458 length:297 start_codon:yes stop_codon:yes gene_type:complete